MVRAAILAAAVLAMAGAASAQTPIWPDIKLQGWTFLGENPSRKFYFRAAPAAAGFKRLWVRTEYFAADSFEGYRYRSSAALYEFDCPQESARMVQATLYAESNLGGDHTAPRLDPNWGFAVPESVQDRAARVACGK